MAAVEYGQQLNKLVLRLRAVSKKLKTGKHQYFDYLKLVREKIDLQVEIDRVKNLLKQEKVTL